MKSQSSGWWSRGCLVHASELILTHNRGDVWKTQETTREKNTYISVDLASQGCSEGTGFTVSFSEHSPVRNRVVWLLGTVSSARLRQFSGEAWPAAAHTVPGAHEKREMDSSLGCWLVMMQTA